MRMPTVIEAISSKAIRDVTIHTLSLMGTGRYFTSLIAQRAQWKEFHGFRTCEIPGDILHQALAAHHVTQDFRIQLVECATHEFERHLHRQAHEFIVVLGPAQGFRNVSGATAMAYVTPPTRHEAGWVPVNSMEEFDIPPMTQHGFVVLADKKPFFFVSAQSPRIEIPGAEDYEIV